MNEKRAIDASDPLVGRTLGEFVVQAKIGEGGFGAVYRAEQPLLSREAVIKVLHGRFQQKQEVVQRFLREAKVASRLDHPFAAHIYAFGAEPDGLLWIAMELVRGTPLDRLLEQQGKMPLDRLVPLVERICDVVQSAHDQGIVHRDLKPGNVMVLSRAGRYLPKLLDLGIAKLTGESGGGFTTAELTDKPLSGDTTVGASITQHGELLGSPAYMAPEQWVNSPTVGPQADLYALGILVYESAIGRAPFQARTLVAMARAHAQGKVPPVGPELPAALDGFFARALAKQTTDRYKTAIELGAALRSASGLEAVDAELPRLAEPIEAAARSMPQPIAEAVASLAAARLPYPALDAAWMLVSTCARWLSLLALAARGQVGAGGEDDALPVQETLRALRKRPLRDDEWLDLARALTKPFARRRDAHPLPELVGLLWSREGAPATTAFDDLLAQRASLPPGARSDDAQLRGVLSRVMPAVAGLLSSLAFTAEYRLAVPRGNALELWMGPRLRQRPTLPLKRTLPAGEPLLCTADGVPVLALAPLVLVAPPVPSAPDELFLFDGQGRLGPRHVALPDGYERRDDRVWSWLAERVFAAAEEARGAASEERAPYRGLSAFSTADADLFVGREREVEAFVNTLRTRPFAAVVGPSGAGKSSFVYAGVIPSLPDGWRAIALRPGGAPLASLAARLQRDGLELEGLEAELRRDPAALGRHLRRLSSEGADPPLRGVVRDAALTLVIDQFEEVFTLCADPAERVAFAEALVSAASSADARVRVILTMRDDFLLRAEQLPALRARLAQGLQLVTTPSESELERVLVEPARRLGYEFEDRTLPRRMAAEVASLPGALPLLSFTAMKLWEQRDRNFKQLRTAAYDALGGVGGALAQHAEQTLAQLGPEEQRLVREAFRHLVTSEGTRAVLTRPEMIQVLGGARGESVLEKLVAARLLVVSEAQSGEDRVEVVHEALLSAWPRLVEWRREDQEGARLRDQLRAAAKQWHERGRPVGLLWRGEALTELELWRKRHASVLPVVDEDFAAASLAENRRGRRLRAMLVTGVIAGLSVALFFVASARGRAEKSAALAQEKVAQLDEEQGRAYALADDPLRAFVYLERAATEHEADASLSFLLARAVNSLEAQRLVLRGHSARVTSAGFLPDGGIATTSVDGTARLWDASGKERCVLRGHTGPVMALSTTRDGRRALTSSRDGTARLWDTQRCAPVAVLDDHHAPLITAFFSADDRFIVTGGEDDLVRVWDAATGKKLRDLAGQSRGAIACFSPDGNLIATADGAGVVRLWEAATGRLAAHVDAHEQAVYEMRFSRDGRHLLTAGTDHLARLWSVPSLGREQSLAGHDREVVDVAISDDGRWIVTASMDRTARLWDARSGRQLHVLEGHTGPLHSARFSPDGTRVLTSSADGVARVWDRASGTLVEVLSGHVGQIDRAAFNADGRAVITAGSDLTARVWDVTRQHTAVLEVGEPVESAQLDRDGSHVLVTTAAHKGLVWPLAGGAAQRIEPPAGATALSFVADGQTTATASDKYIVLRAADGHELRRLEVGWEVRGLTASADGRLLAARGESPDFALWSLEDGKRLDARGKHTAPVTALRFSHDGRWLLSASNDHSAIAWRSADLAPATSFAGHVFTVNSADMSRDDAVVATASDDKRVLTWSVATGKSLASFEGHTDEVMTVAFSPDGSLLATGGTDTDVMLWDAKRGRALARLHGHSARVVDLTFCPDGRCVISGSEDGRVRVTSLPFLVADVAALSRYARCRVPLRIEDGRLQPAEIDSVRCAVDEVLAHLVQVEAQ